MKPKTYLITGATGDTGSKAVRLLVENGHTVKAFVHKVDRRSAKLAELGEEVVAGDLLDFGAVRTLSTDKVKLRRRVHDKSEFREGGHRADCHRSV